MAATAALYLDMKFHVRMTSTRLGMLIESTFLPGLPSVRQVRMNLMLLFISTRLSVILKLMLVSKPHFKKYWWSVETRSSFRSVAKLFSLQEKVITKEMNWVREHTLLGMFYHQGWLCLDMLCHQGLL